jgi:hypothetical protein
MRGGIAAHSVQTASASRTVFFKFASGYLADDIAPATAVKAEPAAERQRRPFGRRCATIRVC